MVPGHTVLSPVLDSSRACIFPVLYVRAHVQVLRGCGNADHEHLMYIDGSTEAGPGLSAT
jgi:hypothetical protein